MALIACPECEKEISDTAMKCPSCGLQLRKPKRGFFGKLIKYGFIVFNALMAWWLIGGVGSAASHMDTMSGAEKAGTAIGAGLGAAVIMGIWLFGTLILGLLVLFTRPKN